MLSTTRTMTAGKGSQQAGAWGRPTAGEALGEQEHDGRRKLSPSTAGGDCSVLTFTSFLYICPALLYLPSLHFYICAAISVAL
jgi:hypothetical protein